MTLNPYESPRSEPEIVERQFRDFDLLPWVLAVAWGMFLFLGIPAMPQIPMESRWLSTLITVALLVANLRDCSRWWHFAMVAPLFVIVAALQFLVWIFPQRPWSE